MDSIVKTLVNSSHKTLEILREEIVDNDEIINIVNETKIINKEDRYNRDSIKDLRTDNPYESQLLEEALINYTGEND